MPVSLRPVDPDDEDFLYELFCQTLGDDLTTLDAAQRAAILRIQFKAQLHTYSAQFPRADHQIIMLDDRVIGRVLVERTESEHRGVDIALLPEYRSGGIGTMLIQELLDEAAGAGKPFRISVVRTNPALHLYDRLGFKTTGESLTHFMLEWVSER
ncbi:MAG TPA: GNAT family N-acetyltransferase [Blastocatellia bacterium]|jgi:ribosomal protein S18 acetylase RimI-like enzyme|nr:GNAT family N-acetyltransferase [Blastocatellia bacterium]